MRFSVVEAYPLATRKTLETNPHRAAASFGECNDWLRFVAEKCGKTGNGHLKQNLLNPQRRREWREAQIHAAAVAAVILVFVTIFMWEATPALIDSLSGHLNFRFGLSACARGFSTVLLGGTLHSAATAVVLLGLMVWGFARAYTEKDDVRLLVKSSVGPLIVAAFLLFPLFSGDGIWWEGRRRTTNVVLEAACIRSHVKQSFGLEFTAIIMIIVGAAGVAYQLLLNRAVREGWSPLRDDADAVMKAQRQNSVDRLNRSGSRVWFVVKWAVTAYAALAVGLAVGSLRLTVEKAYRDLAWEHVLVPVVGVTTYCIIERDRTGRGVRWIEVSRAHCSPETEAAIREDLKSRKSPPGWRVSTAQFHLLRFTGPEGQTVEKELGHDYVPHGTPIGAMIDVVRDPANAGDFDTGFTAHQKERMLSRLKMLAAGCLAIYLLHFFRWRRRPPSGPAKAAIPLSRLERYGR